MSVQFKDKLTNEGFVLNVFKNDDKNITISLYNQSKMVELKIFNPLLPHELELLQEYIELFKESPIKNLNRLNAIKA